MKINLPLKDEDIKKLKTGTEVFLSGPLYVARDMAHKRLVEAIKKKKRLPFDLKGATIYYAGPTDIPKNKIFGSCGPTTSSRMDKFTPALLKAGLKAMIGKGKRSEFVRRAIKKSGAVYFLAIGGAGAYLSKKIKKARVLAYKELGPEAIYYLEVKDFPVIVGIDSHGNDIYCKRRFTQTSLRGPRATL